jgi:tRNA threonylcarbamoyladenosine biosynthesis protein TsaE
MAYTSQSEIETQAIAKNFADKLIPGDAVSLLGLLGAGKTAFVRGIVEGLSGNPKDVNSPTFTLVKTYNCQHPKIKRIYHIDLYRLEPQKASAEIALDEYLNDPEAISVIEWADRLPSSPSGYQVKIDILPDDSRRITCQAPRLIEEAPPLRHHST